MSTRTWRLYTTKNNVVCSIPSNDSHHIASLVLQDIAAAEEESAKSKVGAAASLKQLEKLRKEKDKTAADLDKAEADLAATKAKQQVLTSASPCCLVYHTYISTMHP